MPVSPPILKQPPIDNTPKVGRPFQAAARLSSRACSALQNPIRIQRHSRKLINIALLATLAASSLLGQCNVSPIQYTPSSLPPPPTRTIFPIFGNRFINRSGSSATPPATDRTLQRVRVAVGTAHLDGFRDNKGQMKIPPTFRAASEFSEGLAAVEDTYSKWGFIDESGQVRITATYQAAGDFSDDLAAVQPTSSCNCTYIDKSGKLAFPGTFSLCYPFVQGVARVELTKDHWAFIDKSGKQFADLPLDTGNDLFFSEGLAPSEKKADGGLGFVNKDGNSLIDQRFAAVHPFSEGLATVTEEEDLWGYIDKKGGFAIKPKFCEPTSALTGQFSEGLAFACDPATKKFGFINKQGQFTIAPRFNRCNDPFDGHCAFNGGLAWVETSQRQGYIDTKGKWIWSVPVGEGRTR